MTLFLAHLEGGAYVAAAYLVFFALILIYVAIMAARLVRISRELQELGDLAAKRDDRPREEITA